jgi:trehalose 6-phosphate phosphatase
MKSILDPHYQSVLRKFITRDTLMAFDYDGTLAPIVDDPNHAQMRPATRELLRQVALQYPTVVITGRKRAEILEFIPNVPLREIIGNHGAENAETVSEPIARRVADWRGELEKRLETLAGVIIEDKCYSLSIHYRHTRDKNAEFSIAEAAKNLPGARRIGGKFVLNIVPSEAPDKGTILLRLCERFNTPHSVFVGDDDTDEDVFALDNYGRVLGIRVGINDTTAASYYIPGQTDIDRLLELLLGFSAQS